MARVLLVTIVLSGRTGTEVVCCETARGLRARGHNVSIYAQRDGATAGHLRAEGFEVVTDLAALSTTPDIVQANQTYPLLEAVGRFSAVPAISICHDATAWFNEPIDLPSIGRHVAVDRACRDRIAARLPHHAERIEVLHNAVDLDRFQQRGPLPAKPKRALIIAKNTRDLDPIVAACRRRAIEFDVVGSAVGREMGDLPRRLHETDLVFATARSALEAIAVGCAVIVIDGRGLAGLATADTVASWREDNFGRRLLSRAIAVDSIAAEIDRYDPGDARSASDFVRRNSSLDRYLDRLEAVHREAIAAPRAILADDERSYRLAQAGRALVEAYIAQSEIDWTKAMQARERDFAKRLADYEASAQIRETELRAELEQRTRTWEAAFRREFETRMGAREATFQAEFDAYRDWVAPRNVARRIIRKVRRALIGG
jgi:hypothetical protein